jgi:hypothetical protein
MGPTVTLKKDTDVMLDSNPTQGQFTENKARCVIV